MNKIDEKNQAGRNNLFLYNNYVRFNIMTGWQKVKYAGIWK